jgi:site-specific recombinase XerD
MTSLAPLLQRFFTDRLLTHEHASQHTIASYRDAWRLLLSYARQATGTRPWKLDLRQLDATLITGFLRHLDGPGTGPLFPSSRSGPMSRDAVADRITLYRKAAARTCPSLAGKPITPHTLRHSTAMELRHGGVDVSVIALWLGHADIKSTQVYLHYRHR